MRLIVIKANHKKQTVAKAMYSEAKPFFKQYQNDVTRKAYQNNFRKFLRYCTANHGITSIRQIKGNVALVQDYTNSLRKEGLSDYTVHTYIAPVCKFCEIPMNKIEKGTRKPSQCKRGRTGNGRAERNDNNINNPKYERIVEFQKRVGIRKNELKKLKGSDFKYDDNLGFHYVLVRKGKGGKMQKQRIFPEDAVFIENYFKGKAPEEHIFSPCEFNNKLNYHGLRAKHARVAYQYYLEGLTGEDGENYRKELKRALRVRFEDKKGLETEGNLTFDEWFEAETSGKYHLRGDNRKFALEHGLPTEYDKLALLAVSVFHLSHWRNNVTVQSYMIAI